MKKLALIFGLLASFLAVSPALAATPALGPLAISKTVLNPKTNTFVNNLGLNDPFYHPGETVTFHITVANLSKSTIDQAVVKDSFPSYITYTTGSGDYNSADKTLSFFVYNIKPGTTQTFSVSAIINDVTSLPADKSIICIANKADLTTNGLGGSTDSSSFCIQKVYQPTQTITSSPDTGVADVVYYGLGLAGIAGGFLRRFTKKVSK